MATEMVHPNEADGRRRFKRWLLPSALFLLALLLRLIFQWEWYRSGLWNLPVIDALEYENEALHILAGRPTPEVYWHAPGIAYFIAGIYALFGWAPRGVGLVQALCGSLTVLLVYSIGRRWLSRWGAFAAGAICALYGPLLYFEAQLLRPSLFTLLLLFWLWVHLRWRERAWGALASGLLLGLAAVVRETALLLIPAVALYEIFAAGRTGRWRRAGLGFLGALIVIAPVTVRNERVGREFVLISSSGGINFYIGNQPDSARLQAVRPGREWSELTARARREGGALRPGERSRFYFREGFAYWIRAPWAALRNTGDKLAAHCAAHEIPRNQSVYAGRAHSRLLAALVWRWRTFGFPFGILGPIALLGLAVSLRRRDGSGFIAFLVLIYSAGTVAFFPAARYRIPLIPLAALLGMGGIAYLSSPRRAWQRALGWGGLLVLLLWVNGGWHRTVDDAAFDRLMQAWSLIDKGRLREATERLEDVLELVPHHPEALANLAALHGRRGDLAAARRCAERALAADSLDVKGRVNLAQVELQSGHQAAAERQLRAALAIQPDLAEAWGPLLHLLEEEGRLAEALPLAEAATQRWPRDPTGWVRLAETHLRLGQWPAAQTAARRAIEANPGCADAWFQLGVAQNNQGRVSDARESWRRTLHIDSSHKGAAERLSEP